MYGYVNTECYANAKATTLCNSVQHGPTSISCKNEMVITGTWCNTYVCTCRLADKWFVHSSQYNEMNGKSCVQQSVKFHIILYELTRSRIRQYFMVHSTRFV